MFMGVFIWDIIEVLVNLGFGWVVFVILIFVFWLINVLNVYFGGLVLKIIFLNVKRNVLILVVGLIGIIIVVIGIIFKF